MGQLGYFSIGSLDGFIADPSGDFSWAEPDEEVHQYANDQLLGVDLHLYGRRTYELMTVWETDLSFAAANRLYAEFAERWVDADKIVYSSTLEEPVTRRTRLERTFDPEAVRALKDSTPGDLMIAGPTLAGQALRAGLVDVVDQVLLPIVIGGGLPMYPAGLRLDLELMDERRFAGGAVAVRHRVVGPAQATRSTAG
ncbi:dihydrofolate reductase family protein [Citricoccus muralis]|uniref:Dihydrofolate reductase n=1 Tax=Citricoccus muralis TaxID=169134 RepID=A0A3D9LDQ6_9MICC|nr:dihydrofolate reductase family protein [Citricoccus muralis]REE04498.1 dihydrofolate reductase [Citricoccus muralis]